MMSISQCTWLSEISATFKICILFTGNIDFKSKNIKKDTDKVSEVRYNCDEIEPDIDIDVSDIVEKHTLQLQEKFSKIGSHNLKAAQVVKPKTN